MQPCGGGDTGIAQQCVADEFHLREGVAGDEEHFDFLTDDPDFFGGHIVIGREFGADIGECGANLQPCGAIFFEVKRDGLDLTIFFQRDRLARKFLPGSAIFSPFHDERRRCFGQPARFEDDAQLARVADEHRLARLDLAHFGIARPLDGAGGQGDDGDAFGTGVFGGFDRRFTRVGLAVGDEQNARERLPAIGRDRLSNGRADGRCGAVDSNRLCRGGCRRLGGAVGKQLAGEGVGSQDAITIRFQGFCKTAIQRAIDQLAAGGVAQLLDSAVEMQGLRQPIGVRLIGICILQIHAFRLIAQHENRRWHLLGLGKHDHRFQQHDDDSPERDHPQRREKNARQPVQTTPLAAIEIQDSPHGRRDAEAE